MEQRAMRTVGILGLVSILGLMTMWLFGLQTVSDPAAGASGAKIYESLRRSLDPKVEARQAVRVTMQLKGKGKDAPRHYTLRLKVSTAVGADEAATLRLIERAADIAAGTLQRVKGELTISGIALMPDGSEIRREFRRVKQGPSYFLQAAREDG